jgi:small subunit ribosomal protein S18
MTARLSPNFSAVSRSHQSVRFFSKDKDFDENNEDTDVIVDTNIAPINALNKDEDDPFGVYFDDGSEQGKIGKALPPKYKRDTATGRLTGDIEKELSEEDKRILKADPLEKDKLLLNRLERHWQERGIDASGMPIELDALGQRIRETEMGMNVLGRSVRAQAAEEEMDDGSTIGRDESGFSQNLTKQEFDAFSKYMKEQYDTEVLEDDVPVQASQKKTGRTASAAEDDPDNLAQSMKWLSSRAQREMDDHLDDNPYSDLMPGDLSPTRLVNRRRAKPIPVKLLHHNNVDLLKRFITPTGQVMNRVQTRLGARDQRRVAKLIKRSRALGLLPYAGQFKVESHGWKYAPDIHEDKEWEKELVHRGLVIKRSTEKVDTAE